MARVKAKRKYTSTLRQQHASETRSRILDAAQRLFSERGYGSTTMESIASEAGVATDTVYASFGNKAGLLRTLLQVRVTGDDSPVPLLDREGPQGVRAQPTQRRQVAAFAADLSSIIERARPVDDIMRGAAAVDVDIASFRDKAQESRYQNMRQFVSWLAAKGPLRAGLTKEDATAIVWTMTSPEVHRLLRFGRGWTPERYTDWLAESLTRILLR